MNYNLEMAELFKSLGIDDFKIRELTSQEMAKPSDWANLEKRIALRVHENEVMLAKSELNAARSALC